MPPPAPHSHNPARNRDKEGDWLTHSAPGRLDKVSAPTPIAPPPSDNWAGGAPRPVGMLAYSSFQGRPPLVTGLGITSIVIASLSLIGALFVGLMTLPWLMASAFAGAAMPAAATVQTTPAGSITAEQADAIAAALCSRQPLSATDQQMLAQALPLIELPFAAPADGQWTAVHITSQLSGTSSWGTGTATNATFSFTSGGTITVGAGTVNVNIYSANGDFTSTSVTGGTVGATSTMNLGIMGFADGSARLLLIMHAISTLLSLGLAALLLVAGIQTVRGGPLGRTLHLWWAWPKLVVGLIAAVISYLFWRSLFGIGGGGGGDRMMALAFAGGGLALSIGWPVAVLFILRSRSLRAYYRSDVMA